MDDVVRAFVPIVGAVVGFVFGGPAGAQLGFAIGSAISVVATIALRPGSDLSGDAQQLGDTAGLDGSREQGQFFNTQSTVEPVHVIYGRARVAGIRVYASTTGATNEFLHQVMVWSEGEIDSIEQVLLDDEDGPTFGGSRYEATHHTGADTQAADSNLVARDTNWSANHRLRGIAYSYFRLEWNNDDLKYEGGTPVITAIVKGKKLFDVRDSSTAWSDNPALCVWDLLTNTRYGKGIASSLLESQTFIDAANYCDELVSVPDGAGGSTTQKRYTCNGVMRSTNTSLQNLRQLLTSCRGTLIFSGGSYKLKMDKVESATFTFDESNILGKWDIGIGSKASRYNRIRVRHFDPNDEWKPNIQILDSPTFRTEDKELILERDVLLPFTNNSYTALHYATIDMKASRQGLAVSLTASLEAMSCEVTDVVKVTHTTPGWTDKLFRIVELELQSTHEIRVALIEYEATVYDLDTLADAFTTPDTTLPSTSTVAPPSNFTAVSGDTDLFVNNDGTVMNFIKMTWDPAGDAFVNFYEVQFKKAVDSIWTNVPNIDGSQTEAFAMPVNDGINYDLRIRSVNFSGRKSTFANIVNHLVVGKAAPPPDVTTFTIQRQPDGTRQFDWTLSNPPKDLKGYLIRYKSGSGAVWADMTALHVGFMVTSPFESNLLAAGTYTFGIKAIDTSDNESVNALIVEATLEDPRIVGSFGVIDFHRDAWVRTGSSFNNSSVDPVTNDLVANSTTDWNGLPSTWDAWTAWNNNTPAATYTFFSGAIDLGGDVVFTPLTSVTAVNGNVSVMYKYKIFGGSYQGSWQTVTAPITARYIKVRIQTTSAPSNANDSRLTAGLFVASGEVIEEDITDLDMTDATFQASANYLGVGDIRLPITKSYAVISTVLITLQSVGAGYSWELIDKTSVIGPRIKIYNNSNALVNVTIDAVVRGLA